MHGSAGWPWPFGHSPYWSAPVDRDHDVQWLGSLRVWCRPWRFEMVILIAASCPLIWKTKVWKPYVTGLAIGLTPTALFLTTSGPQGP